MTFYRQLQEQEEWYPVFKFLSKKHAAALLERGNVHLPRLASFRDAEKHGGLIGDEYEGSLQIENKYTYFAGRVKDAEGLLPLKFPPYKRMVLHNCTLCESIELTNAFVYCVTQFFLSESLKWAIEEGKESCVLITDPIRFSSEVSKHFTEVDLCDFNSCSYTGRHIRETDPASHSLSNCYVEDLQRVAFLKPEKYEKQREARAVWFWRGASPNARIGTPEPSEMPEPEYLNRDIPSIRDLCIPVSFKGIRSELLSTKNDHTARVGLITHLKSSDKPQECFITSPRELFYPVVFQQPGRPMMLSYRNRDIGAGIEIDSMKIRSRNAIGLKIGGNSDDVLATELNDISRLEFIHEG